MMGQNKPKTPEEGYLKTLVNLDQAVHMIGSDLRALRTHQRRNGRASETRLEKENARQLQEYGKTLATILQAQTRAMAYMKLVKAGEDVADDVELKKMMDAINMTTWFASATSGKDALKIQKESQEEVFGDEPQPDPKTIRFEH